MVNNLDWTQGMSAIEFLRDIGKHFRVNKMIAKEAVARRLESQEGISYTEFSYQILQGMDFLELYRRYGCTLQTGGSDQWGNLTSGTDLIHQVEPDAVVHALGTPLITKADGTKFGKTESGTVWLDPEMTTPYAFYQFWLNADDRDVSKFLRIFSFRSREEIEELEKQTEERPQARAAQRALAEELTTLVHGAGQTAAVTAASRALFGQGELAELDEKTLTASLSEVPHIQVAELGLVVDLLAEVGLVASKSAARRTVKEGGAYVNNVKVAAEDAVPAKEDLLHGRWLVLRRGKKNLAAVEVTGSLGLRTKGADFLAWGVRPLRRACPQTVCFLLPIVAMYAMSTRKTMTIAATSWNACRLQSMPRVDSTPKPRAMALPAMAPSMPQMVVSQRGLCCLPGMIALAIRPSTNPTMIAHNQPMAASSYGST